MILGRLGRFTKSASSSQYIYLLLVLARVALLRRLFRSWIDVSVAVVSEPVSRFPLYNADISSHALHIPATDAGPYLNIPRP